MMSGMRSFLSRHRRKFVVTGIVVGGTVLFVKYLQRRLTNEHERQTRDLIEKTRRTQHFELTENTCNQTIFTMCTEVLNVIIRLYDTEEMVEKLRDNPNDKLLLWGKIKKMAFTRLTAFIYASTMIVMVLRVEMNLLGGYLYQDIKNEKNEITPDTQQKYLSLVRHFFDNGGLNTLLDLIESKVESVFKTVPLNRRLSITEIEQLFYSVQMAINSDVNDPNRNMSKYLLPVALANADDNPVLTRMFNETLDILETDDASIVSSDNICRGFSLAIDAIMEGMTEVLLTKETQLEPYTTLNGSASLEARQRVALNINKEELALARIIPIISQLTAKGVDISSHSQNLATSLVTLYVVSEKAKIIGANVYELFSL